MFRLKYPICLLICMIPGLINRIMIIKQSSTHHDDKNSLPLLSSNATIMLSSSGFFILIINGLTLNAIKPKKKKMKQLLEKNGVTR